MTKASAAPRPYFLTITGNIDCLSRSPASSTPMARACTRMTVAWCPTSLCRRSKTTDITIYGDGNQTRSFCYVDDLVDGLIRLMESSDDVTGPINLGNPSEFTVRELAQTIIDLTGSKSKLVYRPLPTDDPKQRQPDISRAEELLNWRPTLALREGLVKTIAYFDDLLVTTPIAP